MNLSKTDFLSWVGKGGIEPPWIAPYDFESYASANSATRPNFVLTEIRVRRMFLAKLKTFSDLKFSTISIAPLVYQKTEKKQFCCGWGSCDKMSGLFIIFDMSQFYNDAIFWIEVDKIKPNPYQPRREFDPVALQTLADSIRQYGVLQALVVTRNEVVKEDGGLAVEYELIAGERRLRASKLAGIREVPCLIKTGEENSLLKLELAIIENIQREDLNAVDRARAFERLVNEFGFKHNQIAEKMGKSREYVSNTLRLLTLPEFILQALSEGKITEGHARPLMMLTGRLPEQETLFKEIIFKKLTVREAEAIARTIAQDRIRKKEHVPDPELVDLEEKFAESLGTRVHIERRENGGKLSIDFFSNEDLHHILELVKANGVGGRKSTELLDKFMAQQQGKTVVAPVTQAVAQPVVVAVAPPIETELAAPIVTDLAAPAPENLTQPAPVAIVPEEQKPLDDRTKQEVEQDENELYAIKNFSL